MASSSVQASNHANGNGQLLSSRQNSVESWNPGYAPSHAPSMMNLPLPRSVNPDTHFAHARSSGPPLVQLPAPPTSIVPQMAFSTSRTPQQASNNQYAHQGYNQQAHASQSNSFHQPLSSHQPHFSSHQAPAMHEPHAASPPQSGLASHAQVPQAPQYGQRLISPIQSAPSDYQLPLWSDLPGSSSGVASLPAPLSHQLPRHSSLRHGSTGSSLGSAHPLHLQSQSFGTNSFLNEPLALHIQPQNHQHHHQQHQHQHSQQHEEPQRPPEDAPPQHEHIQPLQHDRSLNSAHQLLHGQQSHQVSNVPAHLQASSFAGSSGIGGEQLYYHQVGQNGHEDFAIPSEAGGSDNLLAPLLNSSNGAGCFDLIPGGEMFPQKRCRGKQIRNPNEKTFACLRCPSRFKTRSDINRHNRIVHLKERPYRCTVPTCRSRFAEKGKLKRHTETVHDKLRPHVCHACGAAFGERGNLNQHLSSRHGAVISNQVIQDVHG